MKSFSLRLAGATLGDRFFAALGALLATALMCVFSIFISGATWDNPLLFAPLGASAVLVFAVPASPLAQPVAVVGGNTLCALAGLACAALVPDKALAAACAVGLAIVAMSLCRCLHPPGGAVAILTALGSPAMAKAGLVFPFAPVAVDSLALVGLGIVFHRFSRHSYPHRPQASSASPQKTSDLPAAERSNLMAADIDAVLAETGEAFDINREDLDRILRRAEKRALARSHVVPTCADIMARDVVRVVRDAAPDTARDLLVHHAIRTLPVVDAEDRVLGVVGLRELLQPARRVEDVMSEAVLSRPDQSILSLLDALTDGRSHAAIVTQEDLKLLGLVSQTDLLVALSRLKARESARFAQA